METPLDFGNRVRYSCRMPRSADYARVELVAGEEPEPSPLPDSDTPFRIS